MKKIAFILQLLLFCFVFWGCNYNFYLAQKLEAEGKFEEAGVEYSRAYFQDLNNKKYEQAYKKNALKVVQILEERYKKQIQEQKFSSAYQLLEKSLELSPENVFFQQEVKKWQSILLAGKVLYPKGKQLDGLFIGDKIYPVIRFNTPIEARKLEAIIAVDGNFAIEDVFYQPSAENYLQYTIELIGFKYLPFSESGKESISNDSFIYYDLVLFHQPKLLQHQGNFSPVSSNQKTEFISENYWRPSKNIAYSSKIDNRQIIITTNSPNISFLPLTIYQKEQRSFLNYGTISLKKTSGAFLWSVARESEKQLVYLSKLQQNYYYLKYLKNLQNPYSLKLENALQP